jgi:hypothetical protein
MQKERTGKLVKSGGRCTVVTVGFCVTLCGASLDVVVLGETLLGDPQTPAQPAIKGQAPDRGRPTKHDDEQPLLDFDAYFLGTWTFEWDVPESPLGPAGRLTGTTVYKPIDGKRYEATTTASGPAGDFTVREVIEYEKASKALSRQVTDSRGYVFSQSAHIGSDLGGFYNIFYESEPFTADGKSVRMKHTLRLMSPLNYRVSTSISVDGGPFVNYGTPWWRKQ